LIMWTSEERRILCNNYHLVSKDEMMRLLPNRTWVAIVSQVHYLKKRGYRIKKNFK